MSTISSMFTCGDSLKGCKETITVKWTKDGPPPSVIIENDTNWTWRGNPEIPNIEYEMATESRVITFEHPMMSAFCPKHSGA